MLYYALSNSKGKHCINNVIMCMSILVDRGPVVYIIDNYYFIIILMVPLHFLLTKKTLPNSKLHKKIQKCIPSAQKSTKNILKPLVL